PPLLPYTTLFRSVEFATDGDGEPILAAFHHRGAAAVRDLRGMFAFAIWDTVGRRLFVARDPFGVKPLYLATGPGGTAFASAKRSITELVDMRDVGDSHDTRALQQYVTP